MEKLFFQMNTLKRDNLVYAAATRDVGALRESLDETTDINLRDNENYTLLMTADGEPQQKVLRLFFRKQCMSD